MCSSCKSSGEHCQRRQVSDGMERKLDQLVTGQKTSPVNNTGKKTVQVCWAPTLKYSTSSWAVITEPLISFSTMFSGASTMGTSTCSCSRKSGSISEKVTGSCQIQERSLLSHTMQSCLASSLNCLTLAPVDEDHSQPRHNACTSPENGTKVTPKKTQTFLQFTTVSVTALHQKMVQK